MPIGEAVGEFFLRIVWEVLLQGLFEGTGWVVTKFFTFGKAKVSSDIKTVIGGIFWVFAIIALVIFL